MLDISGIEQGARRVTREAVKALVRKLGMRSKELLQQPVRHWLTPVEFFYRSSIAQTQWGFSVKLDVYTKSHLFHLVNEGTRPHDIVPVAAPALNLKLHPPLTRPFSLTGHPSERGEMFYYYRRYASRVHHPGAEPRFFTYTLYQILAYEFPEIASTFAYFNFRVRTRPSKKKKAGTP